MTDDSSREDRRRRGLELQAGLPQSTGWAARWDERKRRRSEGAEVAEGTVGMAMDAGLWGLLLAIPGGIIWLVRRLRRERNSSHG